MGKKKTLTKKSNKAQFTVSLIGLIFISLAVLFVLIGFFGDVFKSEIKMSEFTRNNTQGSLTWFFKDGWESIFMETKFPNKNLKSVEQFGFILHFISYICMLAGGIWAAIKMSEGWTHFAKKDYSQNKLFLSGKIIILMSIAYVIIGSMFWYINMESVDYESGAKLYQIESWGWGAILVVVGIGFAFIASSLGKVLDSKYIDVKNVVLDRIPALLIFILIIVGFNRLFGLSFAGQSIHGGFIYLALEMAGSNDVTIWSLYWIGLIATVIALLFIILSIENKKNEVRLVFYILSLVFAIAGGILIQQSLSKYVKIVGGDQNIKILFGVSYIIQIILLAISSGLTIANLAINKNLTHKNTKQVEKSA